MRSFANARNRLRVLFISGDRFPPFRVDLSILFRDEIAERGIGIDWLIQSEKPCRVRYRTTWGRCRMWVGATDTGNGRIHRIRKHFLGFANDWKMVPLIRGGGYDFIQVKDKFVAAIMGLIVAKLSGIRFVYWLSYPFPEAWIHRVKEGTARYPVFYLVRGVVFRFLLYKIILPVADHVFVQSEQMKRDIIVHGVKPEKMTAIPMGVDLNIIPFDAKREGMKEAGNEKVVLYLGTLLRVRRMDFLIRVFARVQREVPEALLYLVGSGEDPEDEKILQEEAERLGVSSQVIFTGFVGKQKMWQHVRRADVCISPFFPTPILNSTSPTKLIEYMAMGKAVVANDHPEQRLVISESGGGICVPWDEAAFASAIVELLNDPARAEEMGKKGREYVEKNRSYKIIADMVERKYHEIVYQNQVQHHGAQAPR